MSDTPTPKFCYHGNAVDCCDACDREETIGKLKSDLAAAQEELERVRDKCNEHYMALAAAQEARQRAEERAQAWREKTHAAEDVALAALASFALTQSVDDYPEDHWSHKAERIRTIRAAIDAAREGK